MKANKDSVAFLMTVTIIIISFIFLGLNLISSLGQGIIIAVALVYQNYITFFIR